MWAYLKAAAKQLGHSAHSSMRHSRPVAQAYLDALGMVCRSLPDGTWKAHVFNSVHSVPWPEVRLRPVRTRFPAGDFEVALVPHLGEFDFKAQLYRRMEYETEVFRWLDTRSYRTVIEIGANIGVFSLFFAKRYPAARVYAFEPSREAYGRLLANVRLNNCPNLSTFNCAIYNTSGILKFYEPAGHLTNGSLDPSFASAFAAMSSVNAVPVLGADCLEPLLGDGPTLVKIDVEGAEPEVLSALGPIIRRHRPDLLIEVLPVTESALNRIDFISGAGYVKLSIQAEGPIQRDKFVASHFRDYALLPAA